MTDKTTICNMALGRIRHSLRVTNIATDTSETGKQLNIYFNASRNAVLEACDWGFARTFEALALSTRTPMAGWTYEYQYPTKCIRALRVTDESGGRLACTSIYDSDYNDYTGSALRKVPFQRMSRPEDATQVIVTDLPDAYLLYTQAIEDTERWPATFVDAFAWLLGANVGPALKSDAKITGFAMEMYLKSIGIAKASTFNEQRPDAPPDSPSVAGR